MKVRMYNSYFFYDIINIGDNMRKIIIPAIIITCIIAYFVFDIKIYNVTGHSMNKTLFENEKVVTTKIKFKEISRGDIIAFEYENSIMIKRVIGVPNDVISSLEDGTVMVNGNILEEDYLEFKVGESEIEYPYTVPEDSLFVLGDNRSDSMDSRIIKFGTVKESQIKGQVSFVLWKTHTIK